MSPALWAQQQTKLFFDGRTSPTQAQCDQLAMSISGASKVRPVDNPGSLSYTVLCNDCPGPREELIMSFREPGGRFNGLMVELARNIHGDLVPESTFHGNVEGADPPLSIYSMNYLPGSALLEVQSNTSTWVKKRRPSKKGLLETWLVLSGLIASLDSLFARDYPQVLTHGDFSITNNLINEETFEITGIVDWSLASIMPFGADLDILFLTTGFMTLDGWHDYSCKPRLLRAFWDEFWDVSGIREEENRKNIKASAEAAAKIWAVLRLAFRRNADGSPSEEVLVSARRMEQLRAWVNE